MIRRHTITALVIGLLMAGCEPSSGSATNTIDQAPTTTTPVVADRTQVKIDDNNNGSTDQVEPPDTPTCTIPPELVSSKDGDGYYRAHCALMQPPHARMVQNPDCTWKLLSAEGEMVYDQVKTEDLSLVKCVIPDPNPDQ